jgi:hypothetical protein
MPIVYGICESSSPHSHNIRCYSNQYIDILVLIIFHIMEQSGVVSKLDDSGEATLESWA